MLKLKNININYFNLLYIYYLIQSNSYIIFLNLNSIDKQQYLNLKIELAKETCYSFALNSSVINALFAKTFQFLCSSIFSIYIFCYLKFLNILAVLNNIYIFFSFKKLFSNLSLNTKLLNSFLKYKTFNNTYNTLNIVLNTVNVFLSDFNVSMLNYINIKDEREYKKT